MECLKSRSETGTRPVQRPQSKEKLAKKPNTIRAQILAKPVSFCQARQGWNSSKPKKFNPVPALHKMHPIEPAHTYPHSTLVKRRLAIPVVNK